MDPILSRTHPHCSGSSDHPRLRLHLTPPCSLVLFVRKWFKQQSCAERIHGSLSFYGYCLSTESTLPYYPLQRVCISPSVLHIGDPRTRSPLACVVFCDLWILMELSWPFTFLPRNSSQFACASNVPGPTIGYSRWKRSSEWLSLPHRFFETLKMIALAQEEWLRSAPSSVSGQLSQWTGWSCLIPRVPRR